MERSDYAHAGSAGGRNTHLNVSARVYLSSDGGDLIQVTAGGYDVADAVAWAEDWARERYSDDSYAMDEYEAA